jgi:muramoyltetrapeptide carboxypeptidase
MADARPLAGRTVRVVAPARWISEATAQRFAHLVAEWGGTCRIDPQCLVHDHQLAGSDETRAAALRAALQDDDVDIIWSARGGYGAARLLPALHWADISPAKVLIGYSDVTMLHGAGWGRIRQVHGPMPIDLERDGGPERLGRAARYLGRLLHDEPVDATYALGTVRAGHAEGRFVAANLAVLTRLLGTPYAPDWRGPVILALEDVGEYRYALDRLFVHLAQSRLAPTIAGLVLGDFTDLEDNEVPWGHTVEEMAALHFPGLPIATGLPLGHGTRNDPFLLGAPARLALAAGQGELTIGGEELA